MLTKRFIKAIVRKNKHKKRKKNPSRGNGFNGLSFFSLLWRMVLMKVDPKSSSPIIITSTRSREWCTVWNPIWMIRWDKMRCYQLIKKIGHHLDLIHKLMFRAPAWIGLHAVYIYVHTNSGATALVDSWQFSTMNSVRRKKKRLLLLLSVSVPWSRVEPNIVNRLPEMIGKIKKSRHRFRCVFAGKKKTRFSASPYIKAATDKGKQKLRKKVLVLEVKRVQDRSVSSTFGYLKL